jgi:hypothetical protein
LGPFAKRNYEELGKLKDFLSFEDTKKRVDWSNIAQELLSKPGTVTAEVALLI